MLTANSQTNELFKTSAAALAALFSSGKQSPVEVTKAMLARAETVNAELNAFVIIDHEGALAAAQASEKRWKAKAPLSALDGIPTTLKDIVYCQNLDVRYGSKATSFIPNVVDAPSVARLRAAGTVFLGLTTTPEFGWKAVTDNLKNGITRNPWDPTKTPGGSSGGAAVAAATGAGILHLGTDGGGSIRIPASFSGIVGHKPSYGRVAAYPLSAFGTVAHIGPMARSVSDVASMLRIMAGQDVRDWTQPPTALPAITPQPINWSGKRIAYWKQPCIGIVEPQIANAVEAVLADLQQAGAEVVEIRLPDQDALLEIFYRHWYVGAANRLSAIDESLYDSLDPGFLHAARIGQLYSATDRMKAEIQRAQYGAQMDVLLNEFEYIISPTVPISPFDAGNDLPKGTDFKTWVEWSSFSFPINLSQQPACSVPCGLTAEGLPIGLQIIGARGDDSGVLSAALTYEQMYPNRFIGTVSA